MYIKTVPKKLKLIIRIPYNLRHLAQELFSQLKYNNNLILLKQTESKYTIIKIGRRGQIRFTLK